MNQPLPLVDYDAFGADVALVEALAREGGDGEEELAELGALAGSAEALDLGRLANEYPPQLRSHDRYGNRIDQVEYHPAYHALMDRAFAHGIHARPWAETRAGAHVVRAAKFIVWYQVDAGHCCPISMTYSVVPSLRHERELAAEWEPRVTSTSYGDGATCGMAMTEKQGGSDVRANVTRAEPTADGGYELSGHKWFCSAPMSDAFLMLAQAPGGLSCFFVPRRLPDGARNPIRIERLKDKLGDRSNASSEITLDGVLGQRVGEEGRGIPTIIEMVNRTRLDCILSSAAVLRQGAVQATHHCRHRSAFGRLLVDQPLMTNVLADLIVESEAATAAALRIARAYDPVLADEHDVALARLATPALKYWTCKRAPAQAAEALECLGGNGYVEESGLPRLFRQSPLNGIWEGSGNVMCLDVLRAMLRSPESVEALIAELDLAAGADRRLDAACANVKANVAEADEAGARRLVEAIAVAFQGALLVRHAPPAVADAFCASRLDGARTLGTLPAGVDTAAVLRRVELDM